MRGRGKISRKGFLSFWHSLNSEAILFSEIEGLKGNREGTITVQELVTYLYLLHARLKSAKELENC